MEVGKIGLNDNSGKAKIVTNNYHYHYGSGRASASELKMQKEICVLQTNIFALQETLNTKNRMLANYNTIFMRELLPQLAGFVIAQVKKEYEN